MCSKIEIFEQSDISFFCVLLILIMCISSCHILSTKKVSICHEESAVLFLFPVSPRNIQILIKNYLTSRTVQLAIFYFDDR